MVADSPLSSTRPYLLRAMHEWMTDNSQTPLVVVNALMDGVVVPSEHVKDGRIVLNIAWSATRNLQMENESVSFQARFGGVARSVSFPMAAVQGVYARESGQGMVFQDEPGAIDSAPDAASQRDMAASPTPVAGDAPGRPKPGGPGLRLVKSD